MSKTIKETDLSALVDREFTHVIGIDEVGWGAIAGPLVVVSAVVPWDFKNPGIKDSKRYTTENSRKNGAQFAKAHVLDHYIHEVPASAVESYGAGQSLSYGQKKAAQKLWAKYPGALIVVDGNRIIRGMSKRFQVAVPGGDATVPAISAASIIAKVHRDNLMKMLHYPEWEFDKNKGYPTPPHLSKLETLGPIEGVHRMNVRIVESAFIEKGWYGCAKTA